MVVIGVFSHEVAKITRIQKVINEVLGEKMEISLIIETQK